MTIFGLILLKLLNIYIYLLIARMILSWITVLFPKFDPPHFLTVIFGAIYAVTDPPLVWLRKYIKPLNVGGLGLDLAFMALFFGIIILQRIVIRIFL